MRGHGLFVIQAELYFSISFGLDNILMTVVCATSRQNQKGTQRVK